MFTFYELVRGLGLKRTLIFFALSAMIIVVMYQVIDSRGSRAELNQAQQALYQMMGTPNLENSGFLEAHPDKRPSDFVAFLQTDQGASLWPPSVAEFYESPQGLAGQRPGRILRPTQVNYSAYEVDFTFQAQIVYIPLDEDGMIEFQGFLSPHEPPVQTSRWKFPSTGKEIPF